MKKLLSVMMVLTLALGCLFTGCSKKEANTYEVALVTDVGNIDDKSFNQGAWEGVKAYCEENKVTYAYYRPTEDSTAARVETMKSAIEKGAKVVVCPGFLFEESIYEIQDSYPNVAFLLLDGEPHDANYNYKTASNVHCILYHEEQAGYFAGYALVKDGFKNIGFLGGMEVPAVIRYGFGFVQGVNAAAEELGVADQVNVKYWYSGTFSASSDIQTKMNGWYTDGTEIVFSCGGSIYNSCIGAAQAANGKVVGVDVDQSADSELVVTSAMKGLTNSVILSLKEFYGNNKAWPAAYAGTTANLGVADDCVGLPTAAESWRFSKFTVDEYNKLYANVKSGSVVVDASIDAQPSVSVSVDYQN